MEIKGKVHCFFEQSGTFKNEFIKLGIPAEDYDIQDNFGQTDHVIDLFPEIEEGYEGRPSIFDHITPDDLVMAFFPCIRFCNIAEYNQRLSREQWIRRGIPRPRIWQMLKKQADERHHFYILALKMHAVVETRGLRMIMENPWNVTNYTNYFWFMRPTVIDTDRTRRGDWFHKPTAYWFLGCEPTHGETLQPTPREQRRVTGVGESAEKRRRSNAARQGRSGICSEERSMISPDYARNFICDFILGRKQPEIDRQPMLQFKEENYDAN